MVMKRILPLADTAEIIFRPKRAPVAGIIGV
jgi:hypothetical protein